jgi:uncharacterized protein (DUF697 family)
MKRRKKSTRKAHRRVRHNRPVRRKAHRKARRKVQHNRKAHRKARRHARRNPVSANPKRHKRSRRKGARRNPVAANPVAVANPKRRRKARRSSMRHRVIRPLPTLMHRPVFHYRPVARNTMFATANPIGRSPLAPSTASKVGWRQRMRHRKGYKSAKKSRGRFLISRNPVAVGAQTFKANLKELVNLRTVINASQMTLGSIGSPLVGSAVARGVEKTGIVKTKIELDSPAGMACTALGGVILATIAATFSRGKMVENIILGTVGGLAADPAKKFLVPKILSLIGGATGAPAQTAVEAVEAVAAAEGGDMSGLLAGPRGDVAREVRGMSDYATASSIVRASADEQF